jgi:hypothetical protein
MAQRSGDAAANKMEDRALRMPSGIATSLLARIRSESFFIFRI